jgi:glycosyltransferase involved in cell wall biosynthesis
LVVGDGPERDNLERQVAKAALQQRVVFTGAVEHHKVPDYQAALDVLATASLSETQPLAYTEAMAAGKPVVAVQAPGAQDMIEPGKNGLLSPPEAGPEALSEQIMRLVEDPEKRREMGEYARRWVWQFDVAKVAERLEKIYRQAQENAQEAPI